MTERVSRISSHYVVTELAAFPFASESALSTGLTRLCPRLDGPTRTLWREAERVILGSIPSLSLDEFVARRDALWFLPGPKDEQERETKEIANRPLPLLTVLGRLARRVLEIRGTVARPRLQEGEFVGHSDYAAQHARSFWKWLRLAIPPDLLLAGLRGGVAEIETLTPALDRRLRDEGFAELHLHFGAGLDFSDFWAATCSALFGLTSDPQNEFASPGAALTEGRDFADWLLRACLVRYVMARFLHGRDRNGRETFSAYLLRIQDDIDGELGLGNGLLVRDAFLELRRGSLSTTDRTQRFFALQRAFMCLRLHWRGQFSRPTDATDPVSDWSPLGDGPSFSSGRARLVELDFLNKCFEYVERHDDRWFEECLWQSVRVRALYYRHVTQRPMTPGLPWFLRTYARASFGKREIDEIDFMQLAGQSSGAGRGLRSLELRTTPTSDVSWILRLKEAAYAQLDGESNPRGIVAEIGLVLHLDRDRGDGTREGRPRAGQLDGHADPSKDNHAHGARYGQWYLEKKREVFALASVLRHFPESLEIIRGVDLCADEAGIPTWVAKPLLRYLRDTASAAALAHVRVGQPALTLHTTIHAGEDWLHLLGGLRRIDEAREHFHMGAGDRIGHGLALAVDPMRWASSSGPVAMARELRLFDLAWVWGLREQVTFPTAAVEVELRRCMGDMFGQDAADAYLAQDFVEALHDERVLRWIHYPSFVEVPQRDSGGSPDGQGLVQRYLADAGCFRRGRAIIHVDPGREGEMITAIQDWLRRQLDAIGMVIEVNPSSNFLTQQLPNMLEHPVWQLHAGRHEGLPELPVVIGSDDPITFATTLPEEYQLMHDALVLAGRTNDEADRWLDEVRRNSMRFRWTLPKSERRAPEGGYPRVRVEAFLPP